MWIAHYASGLIAKPFAPGIPLSVLCLAGAAADALFFLLNFIGLESFNFDASIAGGCFPYTNDYPYSHSLVGMGVSGLLVAAAYKAARPDARVSSTDLLVIVAAGLSHFLLEWPSHRHDVKLTPHDAHAFGVGLFNYPTLNLLAETAIFLAGLWVYATFAPKVTKTGYLTHKNRLGMIVAFMLVQQAHFCYGAAPTAETRWVHAPIFLGEIFGSCWVLGKLEG
ncbi:predicted protein [Postia placenta Mad-698-R]|uniref:Uncharacterized protein n=2 Tax=Rhodonia placenta TaxID=104341 RepID=A0A1X6NEC0_9APHY|nr:hypothetical protein POSPLADRAFT_1128394 [Postia placenta MAD-698-R-SB12]EED80214.1 predicted protein [Postia placenta Mad-698-R]KAF9817979.1 hypothetical protein IEO21_03054 [Postia placenta]OSX66971.1 hypothetical protein POSPLADRAFT_1128394 [Postia placenta MAD-698-R-SB12]